MSDAPEWTAIVSTRHRKDALLETLRTLAALPGAGRGEVVVADNGSKDATAAAVRAGGWRAGLAGGTPLRVRVIERNDANPCAGRNEAAAVAAGRLLVFLDDDSAPRPGTLEAAGRVLEESPRLGAVGGPACLPGGGQDACALPALSACCGWIVRREAFEAAGGFDAGLFMQAEELGLACRLLAAGWAVGRENAVRFEHRRAAAGRRPARTAWLDLRNNVFLSSRFLPRERAAEARPLLVERYGRLLTRAGGSEREIEEALSEAEAMRLRDPGPPLAAAAVESLFGFERQRAAVAAFVEEHGLAAGTPVALVGFTKHADLTAAAARASGLDVVAVVDEADAFGGCRLGSVPVVAPGCRSAAGVDAARARAVLHTDLNPGRPGPAADPAGRPTLALRSAYGDRAEPR